MAQSVTDPYLVAEELLGSPDGAVVKLGSAGGSSGAARPAVRLTVRTGTTIVAGNTAELTLTLTGAVFAEAVGPTMLDLRNATDGDATGLATSVVSGGAVDDGSVTFLVEATADIEAGSKLSFWVPDLRVVPTITGHHHGLAAKCGPGRGHRGVAGSEKGRAGSR